MRIWSAWFLAGFLTVGCAGPRVVTPVTLDCRALRLAPVTNQDKRRGAWNAPTRHHTRVRPRLEVVPDREHPAAIEARREAEERVRLPGVDERARRDPEVVLRESQ